MGGVRQLAAVVTAAAAVGSCLGAIPAAGGRAAKLSPASGLLPREYVLVASKTAGQQESSRPAERNGAGAKDAREKETRPQRVAPWRSRVASEEGAGAVMSDRVTWLLGMARGGAKVATAKSKTKGGLKGKLPASRRKELGGKVKKAYANLPLATRAQLTLVLAVTLLSFVVDPAYLILDLRSTIFRLQLWRPFTAAAFLGAPSMSWLSNVWFLLQYGQQLEMSEGTAQQVVFLLFQIFTLSILAGAIGLPVISNCLITASLHCCGRMDPLRQVNWLFAIKIKYWLLPFCLAAVDVLQSQNPLALIPHILGILSGHLYYFLTRVWPRLDGVELLVAPESWAKRLNVNKADDAVFRKDRGQGGGEEDDKPTATGGKKSKSKVYKMGGKKKK